MIISRDIIAVLGRRRTMKPRVMKCLSAALVTLISCMLFSCTFPENGQSDKTEENHTEILLEDISMDILFTPEGEPTDIGDFTVILKKGWSFRTDQGTDPPLKGPGGISGSITVRLNNVPVTDTTRKEYYKPIFLTNIDAKIHNEIVAPIQPY